MQSPTQISFLPKRKSLTTGFSELALMSNFSSKLLAYIAQYSIQETYTSSDLVPTNQFKFDVLYVITGSIEIVLKDLTTLEITT